MKLTAIFLISMICTAFAFEKNDIYKLPSEEIIFSFKTNHNKYITLCTSSSEDYIIFRMGTKHKIELEFPIKDSSSWDQFTYSYYLRGGGKQNEGLDLNYLQFQIDTITYVLFNNFSSSENTSYDGIKLLFPTIDKKLEYQAKPKSVKGTLSTLRENSKVKIGDTLYD